MNQVFTWLVNLLCVNFKGPKIKCGNTFSVPIFATLWVQPFAFLWNFPTVGIVKKMVSTLIVSATNRIHLLVSRHKIAMSFQVCTKQKLATDISCWSGRRCACYSSRSVFVLTSHQQWSCGTLCQAIKHKSRTYIASPLHQKRRKGRVAQLTRSFS